MNETSFKVNNKIIELIITSVHYPTGKYQSHVKNKDI